ncbi:MAG: ferritin family protein [Victivallales bacterium]|nr:ferritin family protein [Victivallales bacterium]
MNSYKFNLQEIFEIAEQIERNGAAFYKKAAVAFSDNKEINRLLTELAEQEKEHEKTFSEIEHGVLNGSSLYTSDELTRQYLDAVAGQFVFNKETEGGELADNMRKEEIFDTAILKEKDSIVFYVGLRKLLETDHERNAIDLIIEEEQKHLTKLRQYAETSKYNKERF